MPRNFFVFKISAIIVPVISPEAFSDFQEMLTWSENLVLIMKILGHNWEKNLFFGDK